MHCVSPYVGIPCIWYMRHGMCCDTMGRTSLTRYQQRDISSCFRTSLPLQSGRLACMFHINVAHECTRVGKRPTQEQSAAPLCRVCSGRKHQAIDIGSRWYFSCLGCMWLQHVVFCSHYMHRQGAVEVSDFKLNSLPILRICGEVVVL